MATAKSKRNSCPPETHRIFHAIGRQPDLLKHLAENEFSVFSNQCLNRRIEDEASLKREIAALETERNQAAATINWRFSTTDARHKLGRIYPSVSH